MLITFPSGSTIEMSYPHGCTGYVATKIEVTAKDIKAMAHHAQADPEQFQACMAQLASRFQTERERSNYAKFSHQAI